LNDLWQQLCDLYEGVQQAALPTEDEYASRLTGLRELVEKYQHVLKNNMASAGGPQKIPWRIQNNPKHPFVKQIKSDSSIDTVIR